MDAIPSLSTLDNVRKSRLFAQILQGGRFTVQADQATRDQLTKSLSGLSVLLLEDMPELAYPVSSALLAHGVRTVQHVTNGDTAKQEGINRRYDIMLFDIEVPGIDGLTALAEIRASGKGSFGAPAIIVTSSAGTDVKTRGLLSGADDYVVKGAEPIEIMARIVACLRRSASFPAKDESPKKDVLTNGPLEINLAQKTVSFAGVPVAFGQAGKGTSGGGQSFKILCALMEASPDPVTNSMLLETVWKLDPLKTDYWEGLVTQGISRLRKALQDHEKALPQHFRPLVKNESGGYYYIPKLPALVVSDTH